MIPPVIDPADVAQEAEAPTIDIETISQELLLVQEQAAAEMKAAPTLQVWHDSTPDDAITKRLFVRSGS